MHMIRILATMFLFALTGCGGEMMIESSTFGKNDLIRDAVMAVYDARSKSCGSQPAFDERRMIVQKRASPYRDERREDTLVTLSGRLRC